MVGVFCFFYLLQNGGVKDIHSTDRSSRYVAINIYHDWWQKAVWLYERMCRHLYWSLSCLFFFIKYNYERWLGVHAVALRSLLVWAKESHSRWKKATDPDPEDLRDRQRRRLNKSSYTLSLSFLSRPSPHAHPRLLDCKLRSRAVAIFFRNFPWSREWLPFDVICQWCSHYPPLSLSLPFSLSLSLSLSLALFSAIASWRGLLVEGKSFRRPDLSLSVLCFATKTHSWIAS